MEIYHRAGVRLRLKVRLLKAEVVETLLYDCMTWSPNKPDYDRRRWISPLRALLMSRMVETEARRPHRIVRRRACKDRFREHRGDSAQTEDIVGFVARMGDELLRQRVMFGALIEDKG